MAMNNDGQVVPKNIDAEKSLLGGLIVDDSRYADVADVVTSADFVRVAHRRIFEAIGELVIAGTAVDFVTLTDRLRQRGDLDDCGGPIYLLQLTAGVPRSTNVEFYAEIVREYADREQLRAVAHEIESSVQEDRPARELIDDAQQRMLALGDRTCREGFTDPATLAAEGYAHVEQLIERKPGLVGLRTGLTDLDDIGHGLRAGQFIVIGARPGIGKTALAMTIGWNVAKDGEKTVAFFSLEMSKQELLGRLVSSVGHVDGHRLTSGYVQDADYPRIGAAFAEIGNSGLYVDDSTTLSVSDVVGRSRRLKARRGLDLMVIDYLQLLKVPRAENRNLAIADISRALKLASKDLKVPIVVLSQLSRDSEKRAGDHKPMPSDLRDSGALEQDADVVMLLHRPEVYDGNPQLAGRAQLIIAKQRNGPTGTIELDWIKSETRFANRG